MRSVGLTSLVIYALALFLKVEAFAPPSSPASSRSSPAITTTTPTFTRSSLNTRRYNIIDSVQSMINNFGKKATASHILINPRKMPEDEAKEFLTQLKEEIDNDPVKFAEAASEHSGCPSAKQGGNLGEFGPATMVKNFDKVCFEEEVGVVHGPVSTQFGEHLILITARTGE
uniref:Peptidyl-prolyl cis-trans isomerase n=1 Tax=Helicotheca tamesis TaxID=374047 RepID=A0A7S2N2U3_9STRA|mmetsp:Transcript_8681/g.12036  ORF Transcript_8681/g.12036 Transcript_8681/m.12036 type:complete len:172 (+) Transcript_8681:140-655(+)|eukprot:CAMPEP_0185729086 /NCGR_PEP_ID=MMETSP1171-20130828/4458_1 /TAXON_ID=374046 /ORGANISM="Helicotheca tamensis, Strain CCMP826" /LENGTH=171 /DNA_ID=CAMNT_0028397859 /DNA_START=112 /DNA_END=627 /DNA_ORIENTATION=+